MNDGRPTHLDLFSGIGGFALAARWAGFRTIGFCEIEPVPAAVLKHYWPSVPNYGDIRRVGGIACDLITGGFPCQPFSVAGNRGGSKDDRYLWPEMFRVIKSSRPAWVLGENVTGIISMGIDDLLADLEGIGYAARTFIIPACGVGANHRRDRVWFVAYSTSNRQQGELRKTESQEVYNGTPKTLDSRHWLGGSFANWEQLMGKPQFRRMDDGVSSTMDVRPRLHSYGNAIVPQVAFPILKAIREQIENEKLQTTNPD